MNLLVTLPRTARRRRALATAIATALLAVPGCGIPQLRCACPGPALPHSYNLTNVDTNNSTDSYFPANDSSEPAVETGNSTAHLKSLGGPFQLTSFVAPAKSIQIEEADAAVEQAIQSADSQNSPDTRDLGMKQSMNGGLSATSLGLGPLGMDVGTTSLENSAQLHWSTFFNDPYLTNLINQALSGNQELRILAEEIQIANNEVRARRGEYFPFLRFGAGAGIEKPSLFTPAGAVEDQLQVLPGKSFPEPLPDFLVATNVTWEIDIWRKLRNARDAATLRYLGTAEGRNYVVTRMVSEVAANYYELLALDNQLATLNRTIDIQETSLATSIEMKEAARATELAVQRFQAEVRKNQSEKLIIQQQIVEAENRINFLLGRYPQPVERPAVEYIELNLQALSTGVPSQLLRNRADIRQAERELQAAGLDVQVARARFYPSLGLTAGVGYRAFNTKYLLTSPESLIYNVAGDLVAPVLNRAAIKADYMTANAKQLQSVYNYQRTVLNAFTEVINQVAKVENYRRSIEVKKQQLAALEASVETATQLFNNARAEYVEVLLAQRDMMEARMVLIETKQQQLAAIVGAYQALGGGGAPTTVN